MSERKPPAIHIMDAEGRKVARTPVKKPKPALPVEEDVEALLAGLMLGAPKTTPPPARWEEAEGPAEKEHDPFGYLA